MTTMTAMKVLPLVMVLLDLLNNKNNNSVEAFCSSPSAGGKRRHSSTPSSSSQRFLVHDLVDVASTLWPMVDDPLHHYHCYSIHSTSALLADDDAVGWNLLPEEDEAAECLLLHHDAVLPCLEEVEPATATSTSASTTADSASPSSIHHLKVVLAALLQPSTTAAELESEVLLDVSHLLLDFSVFVTRSRSILQKAQVVGRLLLLVQDYLPDKHVAPEELAIQVLMIGVCLAKKDENKNHANKNNHNNTETEAGIDEQPAPSSVATSKNATSPAGFFRDY